MPNFIAKILKEREYPFGADSVRFAWEARGRTQKLILAKNGDERFFIVVKGGKNGFVIKGEKLTKPAQIGLLQKALEVYRDENTSEILSQAFAVKNRQLTQKTAQIWQLNEFMSEFNKFRAKFERIFIEIGFGSGRHLLFQARNNPNALIIGIEIYKPSIEQVAKLAKTENLDNIRLLNLDARLVLSLINSNLIDKIFLHFPVPWDDSPHRRVVSMSFINECERVLKNNGKFELRSDSKEYANFCVQNFLNLKNVNLEIFKNRNLAVTSKYEDRWKRQEKDIYDVIYTCEVKSDEKIIKGELNFDEIYNIKKIRLNFKNEIIKFSDYFVHFEEIYDIFKDKILGDEILMRVAFGAFNKPEQCFIKFGSQKTEYFIKKPMLTSENLNAHKALQEYLKYARDN